MTSLVIQYDKGRPLSFLSVPEGIQDGEKAVLQTGTEFAFLSPMVSKLSGNRAVVETGPLLPGSPARTGSKEDVMEDVVCQKCDRVIPPERVEAIGVDVETCVRCSTEKPVVGFMVYGQKAGGVMVSVNPTDRWSLRLASRANVRGR